MQTVNINLLPWREVKRKQDQTQFAFSWLLSALIAAGLVFGVFTVFQTLIAAQNERNRYIQQEITALDKDIKKIDDLKQQKAQLKSRMDLIQSLQSDRPVVVRVFDELVKVTPEGVVFTNWSHKDDEFTINAYAKNNNLISQLMRNLDRSQMFEDSYLSNVTAERRGKNKFDLKVNLEKESIDSKARGATK